MTKHKLNQWITYFQSELLMLTEEEFSYKPSSTKWSKQEIVGHLCDSAVNNHNRFIHSDKYLARKRSGMLSCCD